MESLSAAAISCACQLSRLGALPATFPESRNESNTLSEGPALSGGQWGNVNC